MKFKTTVTVIGLITTWGSCAQAQIPVVPIGPFLGKINCTVDHFEKIQAASALVKEKTISASELEGYKSVGNALCEAAYDAAMQQIKNAKPK